MWMLNLWLLLMFLFHPSEYQALKQAGVPCYGYAAALGTDDDDSPQPACPYDPGNINPGR